LSSPRRNPLTVVVPLAIDPNMMERWEMDLSPGTEISPRTVFAGCTVRLCTNDLLALAM